ncbi:MAG TPA: type II toxin-antitoxin system HicB family antitoxin [Ktedonobacterales bacterium]|jgi:predicted RNase H-like HicB family nuclease
MTAAANTTDPHYTMLIEWSDEDQAFLVTLPEWANRVNTPTTHGASYEEAVRNGQEALQDLIAMAQERGESVPAPRVHVG